MDWPLPLPPLCPERPVHDLYAVPLQSISALGRIGLRMLGVAPPTSRFETPLEARPDLAFLAQAVEKLPRSGLAHQGHAHEGATPAPCPA